MKRIIFTVITLFALALANLAPAQISQTTVQEAPLVYDERMVQNGIMYVRIINETNHAIGCSLQDDYSFHTYIIYPNTIGLWHRVYGHFQWRCD